MTSIVNVAGHTEIIWVSGATAILQPDGRDIRVIFEYKPYEIRKTYTLLETESHKKIDKKGLMLR